MTSDARSNTAHPDLDALRRTETTAIIRPRKPWFARIAGTLIVLGVLGAAYAVLQPVLFPPRVVTLQGVRAVETGGRPRAASFVQAAGWVEADPFPLTVRPLVRGIVERLDVLEGTKVVKGETVIAILRDAAIENALVVAQAEVRLRDMERRKAETTQAVAESLLEQKLPLREALAQRQGELSTARAEADRARARRKVAEAKLDQAQVDLTAQQDLEKAGHATPTALATAKARVKEAEERVTELRFNEVRFVAELSRITDLLELAREAVRDPRGLQGAVDEAAADLERADAAFKRAQADLTVAQRNVGHLTIKAPMTGTIMRLEAAPGSLVGPQGEFKGAGEGVGSTGLLNRLTGTICSIYDPQRLQVRVDVPYADLPGIARGTGVEIEAKALPGRTFEGVVHRLVREADITQAKLQIKVQVKEPDEALRPEMICTARFLVKPEDAEDGTGRAKVIHRVQVPTSALRGDAVFLYDPTGGGRARRVAVRIVRRGQSWTEVEGAVGQSAKVILDEVEDGERVRIER